MIILDLLVPVEKFEAFTGKFVAKEVSRSTEFKPSTFILMDTSRPTKSTRSVPALSPLSKITTSPRTQTKATKNLKSETRTVIARSTSEITTPKTYKTPFTSVPSTTNLDYIQPFRPVIPTANIYATSTTDNSVENVDRITSSVSPVTQTHSNLFAELQTTAFSAAASSTSSVRGNFYCKHLIKYLIIIHYISACSCYYIQI